MRSDGGLSCHSVPIILVLVSPSDLFHARLTFLAGVHNDRISALKYVRVVVSRDLKRIINAYPVDVVSCTGRLSDYVLYRYYQG